MDIIAETKEKFSNAWQEHLASRELPCLEFLNDSDQAYQQFRHSIAVINDCLATIKVEVFIVKFLRTNILSDGKCASDLQLAFNVGEITTDLESIFAGETHDEGSGNDKNVTSIPVGETTAKMGHSTQENEASVLDKTSTNDSVNRHLHDKSNEIESQISPKHENEESVSIVEGEANDNSDRNVSKVEAENKVTSPSTQEHPSDQIGYQSANNKGQVTIFTPIPDEHIENESEKNKNEKSTTPNLSPVEDTPIKLDKRSSESSLNKQSHVETMPDDLQSSGNELDNTDATFTDDPFSSDSGSNSPDPTHRNVFLHDAADDSGEILKIMPFSARSTSFYSVDPSFESTHSFDTAEHIYEDIDRYRTITDEEYDGETKKRHLSQSELTLKKHFSVGALRKPKEPNDDVFHKGGTVPEGVYSNSVFHI